MRKISFLIFAIFLSFSIVAGRDDEPPRKRRKAESGSPHSVVDEISSEGEDSYSEEEERLASVLEADSLRANIVTPEEAARCGDVDATLQALAHSQDPYHQGLVQKLLRTLCSRSASNSAFRPIAEPLKTQSPGSLLFLSPKSSVASQVIYYISPAYMGSDFAKIDLDNQLVTQAELEIHLVESGVDALLKEYPLGKFYIGRTKNSLEKRSQSHNRKALDLSSDGRLQLHMRSSPVPQHHGAIILNAHPEQLCFLEKYLILKYGPRLNSNAGDKFKKADSFFEKIDGEYVTFKNGIYYFNGEEYKVQIYPPKKPKAPKRKH